MTDKPKRKANKIKKRSGNNMARKQKPEVREKINKNLKSYGKPGAPPRNQELPQPTKPWSIRNSVRFILRQQIDRSDPQALDKLIGQHATPSEMIAVNTVVRAIKGDHRAVEYCTDQVDGKLAQTNINADINAILSMTDEELAALADGIDAITEAGNSEG